MMEVLERGLVSTPSGKYLFVRGEEGVLVQSGDKVFYVDADDRKTATRYVSGTEIRDSQSLELLGSILEKGKDLESVKQRLEGRKLGPLMPGKQVYGDAAEHLGEFLSNYEDGNIEMDSEFETGYRRAGAD